MLKRVLLATMLALVATTAFAAEVGRVQFGGREVILNDDNTWRYSDVASAPSTPNANCPADDLARSGVVPMAACIEHAVWEAGSASGAQEFVFFSKDQRIGFAIVTEEIIVEPQQFRDAIVQVAATGAGIDRNQVRVFDERQPTVAGQIWNSMRYQLTMQGTPLEYLNYRYSRPGFGAVQMVFWSLPTDATYTTEVAERIMRSVTIGR